MTSSPWCPSLLPLPSGSFPCASGGRQKRCLLAQRQPETISDVGLLCHVVHNCRTGAAKWLEVSATPRGGLIQHLLTPFCLTLIFQSPIGTHPHSRHPWGLLPCHGPSFLKGPSRKENSLCPLHLIIPLCCLSLVF